MTEVWLQSNRRVLALGLAPVVIGAGLGILVLGTTEATAFQVVGWAILGGAAALAIGIIRQLRRPRISYRPDEVLFHLRSGPPVAVPREVVEAFFLGQGPAYLPTVQGKPAETVNLVARLSQKAPEWMHVDVKPALGHWCDGYVTIRGTWCEPLTGDVIRQLNARLRELRTAAQAGEVAAPADSPDGSPAEHA